MNVRQATILCTVLTLVICLPSIIRLPLAAQFLKQDVRATAPQTVEMLRASGIWVVNAELTEVSDFGEHKCFLWDHTYRARTRIEKSHLIATCI